MLGCEALLALQGGICCVAGCMVWGALIAERSASNAWRLGMPDRLERALCHEIMTLRDVKAIAKVRAWAGFGAGNSGGE
jgi:hypothetical protein